LAERALAARLESRIRVPDFNQWLLECSEDAARSTTLEEFFGWIA
jgi:hypothetical protein